MYGFLKEQQSRPAAECTRLHCVEYEVRYSGNGRHIHVDVGGRDDAGRVWHLADDLSCI